MSIGPIHIGLSPCPNDTFILFALLNGKIDSPGLEFVPQFEDIEVLNQLAMAGKPDVVKVSFSALKSICEDYELLDCGGALGFGNGPLLISRSGVLEGDPAGMKIAVPGLNTTAVLLLKRFFPDMTDLHPVYFRDIPDEILKGGADAGLIIHETRFTYREKGLNKICDLGELWERQTGLPIPLGGFVIRKSLPETVKQQVNALLRESLSWAQANPEATFGWIREHAEEKNEDVIRQHIALYVNRFTESLGVEGRHAIESLLL